jgi:hypothetical protein
MTRDEAIKAMRQGKRCTHLTHPTSVFIYFESGHVISESHRGSVVLALPCFDNGWELVKKKVTIKRWVTVDSDSEYSTPDKYKTTTCTTEAYAKASGKIVVPIEITFEVEE